MILFNLLSLLVLNQFALLVSSNEVIGCGGYVRSNTEINFKIIKVKLLTKDGILKYTTESSPVNGYYMIPIYTKGEYVLQVNPPPGWSFEPTEVNINIDGKNDPCTKNEDINFNFKGFGLSGKVVTFGDSKNNGPSGISLDLISNGKVIDTTQSGADGSYYFSNVMPGAYEVEARHSSIKFLTNKVSVILSKENWSAKDNIVVSGYKIEGSVVTTDNSPVRDALVELYFADKSNVDTANFECDLSSKSDEHSRVCHTRTDSNGRFAFKNVVFGKYKLSASLAKDEMSFTMKPDFLSVDLTRHQDVQLSESFKLNQVTLKSRALLADNIGLENGEVYINGQNSGLKTSADGSFVLPLLPSGTFKFEIRSKNVYFEEKIVQIDLSSAKCLESGTPLNQKLTSLKTFRAHSFDVCGRIKMLKEQANANYLNDLTKSVQINVLKVEQNGPKTHKQARLNDNLEYCVQLEVNGNYILKADLSQSLAQIIKLVPDEQKITVTDKPIMEVNFEQLEAKLDGTIRLLSKQDVPSDLKLNIRLDDPKRAWSREILTECAKETIQLDENKSDSSVRCKFSLTNLLFGTYLISTNYDDLFCWKKQSSINVNSESQEYLLEQSGYVLNYELSHKNTLMKILDDQTVLFSKNVLSESDLRGKICLSEAKDYNLNLESCHKYTSSESDVDTISLSSSLFKKNANKVSLKALKTQVVIDVVFKFDDKSEKQRVTSDDLYVEVSKSSTAEKELIKFKLKSESDNQLVFTSKSWFEPNQLIQLNAISKKILFEKNLKELQVNEHECSLNYVQFEANVGIFLVVTVSPADIDEINLVLKSTQDNSILTQETINAAQGYKLGPIRPPFSSYNIDLAKPGYLFTKLEAKTNKDTYEIEFKAEKLGQLKVNVVNSNLKTSLENVLLSLSSENRLFRQTLKTDQNGLASFDNLKPGLYYLIVMMQEYEFVPNSHPIQITDGFHMNLVIEANRIAYSCLGKVSSINGQAESDVQVQAVGVRSTSDSEADNEMCKSLVEASQVESGLGTFRIYNLRPDCEYELSLKHLTETRPTVKLLPEKYYFIVNNSDVTGRNFILLNQLDKIDVTLSVSFKQALTPLVNTKQLNNYVRVKLFKTNQPNLVIQTQFALANSVIYFNSLPREASQQYSVQVELLAASTVYPSGSLTHQQQLHLQQQSVIESVELSFYGDAAHKHLVADFDLGKKNYNVFGFDLKQQQYQNFYFTLPLFILVLGLFLNTKKVQQYLAQFYNYIEQRGGFVKYAQSLVNQQPKSAPQPVASSQKASKPAHRAASKEANNSDTERQTKSVKSTYDDLGDYKIDSVEDSDYQVITRKSKSKRTE